MEITIKEFKEAYLPKLQDEFHQKTQEFIIADMDQIRKKTQNQMETFIKIVMILQKKLPLEIGEIQVALLNTSLYLGKPQLAYTAYDELGALGKEIVTVKRDAGWLFQAWTEYEEALKREVERLNCQQYIRAEGIRQLAWESLPFLQACLYAATKYTFRDMDGYPGFDGLITGDRFYVRVGAYMDWGKTVYSKEEEEDIFFDTSKKKYRFCSFQQAVYNQKTFKELDLRSTIFSECEFVHCNFEQVDLSDACFRNCRIYHCSFHDVKLYGATFNKTTIKKSSFQECKFDFDRDAEEAEGFRDIFKKLEFLDCIVDEESKIRGEE